jgi:hypothetical protein
MKLLRTQKQRGWFTIGSVLLIGDVLGFFFSPNQVLWIAANLSGVLFLGFLYGFFQLIFWIDRGEK